MTQNSRQMDIHIAKLLGYRVIDWNAENPFGIKVKQPNTKMLLKPNEPFPTPDKINGRFAPLGIDAMEHGAPHFSTDLNDAITLWTEDYRWSVYPSDETEKGKFCGTFPTDGDQAAGWVYADTAALAICEAWLDRQRWLIARNLAK